MLPGGRPPDVDPPRRSRRLDRAGLLGRQPAGLARRVPEGPPAPRHSRARGGALQGAAGEGVRVNVVRPGIVETGIHANGGQPDRVARIGPTVPMGRAGLPEEVAAAVLWLLGDAAGYCTGSLLDVAGGR